MASESFIGEVKPYSFANAPRGWAQCNGQLLPISQYQAVFALLGTTYGGNGVQTFALPNLQGRTPVHFGTQQGQQSISLGQQGGEAAHTLIITELPSHSHSMSAQSAAGTKATPSGNYPSSVGTFGTAPSVNIYAAPGTQVQLAGDTIGAGPSGNSGQPHNNIQPYLVLNVCICLIGLFPSRS